MALTDYPRHQLLFGPSPVHRLERLTAHLGGAQIWAKREDCNSGLAFGGNKVRKLEYLAADALQGRAVRIIGGGASAVTTGIARGVDADGALLVEHAGSLHRVIAGEVSVRPDEEA